MQPVDIGSGRKVSGREAVSVHVASSGGAVAAVAVELADGGGSYRYPRTSQCCFTPSAFHVFYSELMLKASPSLVI